MGSPYREVLQQHIHEQRHSVEARSYNMPENIGNIYRSLAEYNVDIMGNKKGRKYRKNERNRDNIAKKREIRTVITVYRLTKQDSLAW